MKIGVCINHSEFVSLPILKLLSISAFVDRKV